MRQTNLGKKQGMSILYLDKFRLEVDNILMFTRTIMNSLFDLIKAFEYIYNQMHRLRLLK